MRLGSPASRATLEDMAMVQQPIEDCGDGRCVSKDFAPIIDRPIGSEEGAGAFVATHDEFEEIFSGGGRELTHADVVNCRRPLRSAEI